MAQTVDSQLVDLALQGFVLGTDLVKTEVSLKVVPLTHSNTHGVQTWWHTLQHTTVITMAACFSISRFCSPNMIQA